LAICGRARVRGRVWQCPGTTGCQRRLWQSVVGRESGIRNRESGFRELAGEPGCERVIRFATRRGFGRFSPHPSPLTGISPGGERAMMSPSPPRGRGNGAPELAFVARKSRSSHDVAFRGMGVGKCENLKCLARWRMGNTGRFVAPQFFRRNWGDTVTLLPCDETRIRGREPRGPGLGPHGRLDRRYVLTGKRTSHLTRKQFPLAPPRHHGGRPSRARISVRTRSTWRSTDCIASWPGRQARRPQPFIFAPTSPQGQPGAS
jgi:hypothetical protein